MGDAPLSRRHRPNLALGAALTSTASANFISLMKEIAQHHALTQENLDACAPLEVQASAIRSNAVEMLNTLHGPIFVRGMTPVPELKTPSRVTTPDAALNFLYLRAMTEALEKQRYRTSILTGSSVHAWNDEEHLLAVGTFEGIRTDTVNKRLKTSLRWLLDHRADLMICHPEGARRVGPLALRRSFRVLQVEAPRVGTSPHETRSNW